MTSVTVATLQLEKGLQMFKSTCSHWMVQKKVTEKFVVYVTSIIHTDVGGAGCSLCCPSLRAAGATCALTKLILNGA